MNKEMQFDEATHTYTVYGRRVPSVTEILKGAGIIDDRWYKKDATSRGKRVHEALELADTFGEAWADWLWEEVEKDKTIEQYLMAYFYFRSAFQKDFLKILKIEEMGYAEIDGYEYCGTYDRLAKINGRLCIIDIKTGAPAAWHGLQLEAYSGLVSEKKIDLYGLYLKPSGRYSLTAYPRTLAQSNDWRQAVRMYYERNK